MGYWNHRIVRITTTRQLPVPVEIVGYELREVHYDDDGVPWGHGEAGVSTWIEDETDDPNPLPALQQQVTWYQDALAKPILDAATDFVGKAPGSDPDEQLVTGAEAEVLLADLTGQPLTPAETQAILGSEAPVPVAKANLPMPIPLPLMPFMIAVEEGAVDPALEAAGIEAMQLGDTPEQYRLAELAGLQAQLAHYRAWVDDLQSGMFINCVYCGHRYGPSDQVPATKAEALTVHIAQCPEHPMHALTEERDRLMAAITTHHDQKADDRCIEDDTALYAAAGLPPADHHVGDPAAMLENCRRYIERRCLPGVWPAYRDLELALDEAARAKNAIAVAVGIEDTNPSWEEIRLRVEQEMQAALGILTGAQGTVLAVMVIEGLRVALYQIALDTSEKIRAAKRT